MLTYLQRYFPGIEIKDVQVVLQNKPQESKNIFKTYWQKDAVDITKGILNLKPEKDGRVFAVFTHLQHENFVYQIQVRCWRVIFENFQFISFYYLSRRNTRICMYVVSTYLLNLFCVYLIGE